MHLLIDTRQVAQKLSETLNRVRFGGQRFVVTRRGQPFAALVPVEILEMIEKVAAQPELEKK